MPTIGTGNGSIHLDDSGLRRLEERAPGRVDQVLERLALEAGRNAAQNIRDVGAIDTGFMVNTTRARRMRPLLWSIGTAAHYGVFIEHGTRYVSPRPWLMPAMEQARARLAQLFRGSLRGLGR